MRICFVILEDMGMKAVGAYLQTLREGRGLSRPWVARHAGTNETSVYRVEVQGQEPRPKILVGFVRAVQASWDDINALLEDDNIPTDEGVKLAEVRLSETINREVDRAINGMGKDEARRLAQRLKNDPKFFEDFIRSVVDPLDN